MNLHSFDIAGPECLVLYSKCIGAAVFVGLGTACPPFPTRKASDLRSIRFELGHLFRYQDPDKVVADERPGLLNRGIIRLPKMGYLLLLPALVVHSR